LRSEDKQAAVKAKKVGAAVVVRDDWEMVDEKVLFVAEGTPVPWHLVEAGFGFLDRWEAAAPLWRYGVLAKDVGGPSDQAGTAGVTKDLRLLLYGHELLFVKRCERGQEFVKRWREECQGGDERLAFLRALFAVKPILCTLPRSWLGEELHRATPGHRSRPRLSSLVTVEVAPGRFVRCKAGEEAEIRERLGRLHLPRRDRQGR
jgi:hypothetical protein